jgi:aryl-alcohol dehydrogenase-like predicted oxidoreductase
MIVISCDTANCSFQVLDRAYELGCTFWDTANIYGDSEELIGKWYFILEL